MANHQISDPGWTCRNCSQSQQVLVAERFVDFADFRISESAMKNLPKYLNAIKYFPASKNTTDIWRWFDLVNQVANYAQLRGTYPRTNLF